MSALAHRATEMQPSGPEVPKSPEPQVLGPNTLDDYQKQIDVFLLGHMAVETVATKKVPEVDRSQAVRPHDGPLGLAALKVSYPRFSEFGQPVGSQHPGWTHDY